MNGVRASLILSLLEKYSILMVQFAASVVVARLLEPAEIGLFSVGASVLAIGHALRDFGVTNYLLQERELTPERVRSALGVTLVVAWSLGLLLVSASTTIAAFYAAPMLADILLVLSCNLFLLPFSSVTFALLQRDMQFRRILGINLFASLVQSTSTVALAWKGYGAMSLAFGGLVGVLATLVAGVLLRPSVARLLPGFHESRRVLATSARASVSSITHELGLAAPDLIIGRVLGFAPAAIFGRANGFVMLFDQSLLAAVRPVSIAWLARVHRGGGSLAEPFLRATNLTIGFAWPWLTLLALTAAPLVRLLYGAQWDAAHGLVPIMAGALALRCLSIPASQALLASGRVGEQLRVQIRFQFWRLLGVIVGVQFGLLGVAIGFALGEAVGTMLFVEAAAKALGVTRLGYWRRVLPALPLAAVAALPAVVAQAAGGLTAEDALAALVVLSAGGVLWFIGVATVGHPLHGEMVRMLGLPHAGRARS